MGWGKLVVINLYECDKNLIKDEIKIKEFIKSICEKIQMNKVGPTRIKRFGKGSLRGYSAMQFIETSTITIHFDEMQNRAFIDIFSCKDFNAKKAEIFSARFFKAKRSKIKIVCRE